MHNTIPAAPFRPRWFQFLTIVFLAAGATGCTAIADRLATRLTDRALSKVEHEITVINGDIALYRQCLDSRGGTCQGDASAALPQAGQVAPLRAGLSAPVAASVDALGLP